MYVVVNDAQVNVGVVTCFSSCLPRNVIVCFLPQLDESCYLFIYLIDRKANGHSFSASPRIKANNRGECHVMDSQPSAIVLQTLPVFPSP